MNKSYKNIVNYLLITLGTALSGFSVSCFLAPNNIIAGGVSGTSILICNFVPLSIGVVSLLINVPVFILGVIKLGKLIGLATVYGTVMLSVFIDVFSYVGSLTGDMFLASIFGGAVSGAGFGLVLYAGATTGGVDILAKIIKNKHRHLRLGKIILAVDLIIISVSVVVFRNIEVGLYSVLSFLVTSYVIDFILEGFNFAKLAFVISDYSGEITSKINQRLDRGVTLLHGSGAYTGKAKEIIMCTIKNKEIPKLKDIIKESDEGAFLLITDAREVLGKGFSRY